MGLSRDKIYGGSFAGFFSSAGVEGSQRTGKYMYIKAWRSKRNFTGSAKPHCGQGMEDPVFRRVSRCVRSAILLAKASVYPLSPAKANVGRFVDDCAKTLLMCDTH